MSSFRIGDPALVVTELSDTVRAELRRYIGQVVEVIAFLNATGYYTVQADDGCAFYARPCALQKLPPQDDLNVVTNWSTCAWLPVELWGCVS